MKNEIKVGDCFKENLDGAIWIVTGLKDELIVSAVRVTELIRSLLIGANYFKKYCTPITRAEFDAALGARFAAIKAELPEVK